MSGVEHLVTMANDIANFFRSESDRQVAIDGIANHIKRSWDPRMCKKIFAHLQQHDGEGLNELARAAIVKLASATPATQS